MSVRFDRQRPVCLDHHGEAILAQSRQKLYRFLQQWFTARKTYRPYVILPEAFNDLLRSRICTTRTTQ